MFLYLWTLVLAFMILMVHLHPQFSATELAFAAIPVGSIGGAWLFFLVSMLLNFLSTEAITISCVAMAVATVLYLDAFLLQLRLASQHYRTAELPLLKLVLPLAGLATMIGVPLYSSRYLKEDDHGNVWTGGSTWADLPIHLHMANSFLFGRNRVVYFDGMHSPVFAGEAMRYPFLPDFHAAALVKAGNSMHDAMWIPGFSLYLSLVVLLFLFSRRLLSGLKSAVSVNVASYLAVFLVICAGGMGGIRLVLNGQLGQLVDGTLDPVQDDVNAPGTINWFGFLAHVLIPQRGATFAYPLVIFVVSVCLNAVRGRGKLPSCQYFNLLVFAGVAAASLPLVQAHALVGLAFYMVALGALEAWKSLQGSLPYVKKRIATPESVTIAEYETAKRSGSLLFAWILSAIIAFIGAKPQLNLFSSHATPAKGFMVPQAIFGGGPLAFISFWWSSLAATVFVTFATGAWLYMHYLASAGVAAVGKKDTDDDPTAKGTALSADDKDVLLSQVVVYSASMLIFLFGNFVKMQPWDRDNIKLFYIWLFVAAAFNALFLIDPIVSSFVASAAPKPVAGKPPKDHPAKKAFFVLTPLLLLLMTTTGFLSYVRESGNFHILYGPDEVAVGEWLRNNSRTDAVILTGDNHRSPAGYYAGRPSLVAFTGWMWSHGYDYSERDHDRKRIMENVLSQNNAFAQTKLYRWGIKYILYEARSAKREKVGETFLAGHIKRVFQSNKYHVFRVKYDGEEF